MATFASLRLKNLQLCVFFRLFIFPMLLFVSALTFAESQKIGIPDSGHVKPTDPYFYYRDLLALVFAKTSDTDGDVELIPTKSSGIERERAMLAAGVDIDVMWASVTKERERKLRVINVDLLKGLNSYRVLLINQRDQKIFDQITTLEQLKSLSIGTGPHWTDGIIMKDNGFTIFYTPSYEGLFKMLAARRFNFISRGLHEIGNDIGSYTSLGLATEQHLMLKYDVPVKYCFFVNKDNKKLAERIERGLKIAQADGSFDALFSSMPSFKQGEDILLNSQRIVLDLKNTTNL